MTADDIIDNERASSAGGAKPDSPAGRAGKIARQTVGRHPLARGFVFGAVVSLAVALLVFQNRSETELEWLWLDFNAPLWLALLGAFLAGLVAGPLLGIGLRRSMRKRRARKTGVDQSTSTRP